MEAILGEALRGLGRDEAGADRDLATIGFLANHPRWWEGAGAAEDVPGRLLRALAEDERVRRILGFNRYRETLYLRKEPLEELLADLLAVAAVHLGAGGAGAGREEGDFARRLAACDEAVRGLRQAAERAGYRVEQMLEITVPAPEEGPSPSGPPVP